MFQEKKNINRCVCKLLRRVESKYVESIYLLKDVVMNCILTVCEFDFNAQW